MIYPSTYRCTKCLSCFTIVSRNLLPKYLFFKVDDIWQNCVKWNVCLFFDKRWQLKQDWLSVISKPGKLDHQKRGFPNGSSPCPLIFSTAWDCLSTPRKNVTFATVVIVRNSMCWKLKVKTITCTPDLQPRIQERAASNCRWPARDR